MARSPAWRSRLAAGRYAILEHNDGWQSRYLHLNNDSEGGDSGRADWDLTVVDGLEEGARVIAGMQIAFVGDFRKRRRHQLAHAL